MGKVRIQLVDISKSYYSETAVTQALRKISLELSEGEFVAITGESGSGKSTLLNIIGGMDTFDDGEMFVDGEATFQYDETDWEDYRRDKIGYVFQDYSLIGHYSVLDNVMSALLIMGKKLEEAREIALEYLKQVGLEGLETHRATELSSGQKQRLSIARALAKDTGIIVADEPTGNLDSETGNQIIRLLKDLSKTRLVIMVTHNYDQVEPYATRKIRLHDGEIISDVSENERVEEEKQEPKKQKQEDGNKKEIASYFAKLNRRTQKGRAILFTAFLFIISSVSFLFIGELFQYADDTLTREYDTKAFLKEDETRLVACRTDGQEITKEDLVKIRTISDVVEVDSCDYANDMNYYLTEGEDYEFKYSVDRIWGEVVETKTIKFLNKDHFVKSVDCVEESDLATGHLPESMREMVLYGDESKLGQEIPVYFTAQNIWGVNQYYVTNLKVVGILKEERNQVYFSKQLCQMMTATVGAGRTHLYFNWDLRKQDYNSKDEYIPVVSESLTGDVIKMSENNENFAYGEVKFHFAQVNDIGVETDDVIEQNVFSFEETNESSGAFIEVSQELFDRYYSYQSPQASVYLTSYGRTDRVLKQLEKMGYYAVSTIRCGVTDYNSEWVTNRITVIAISVGGLLALMLAQILILRSLMKIRIKDFFVLKFIGMRMEIIQRISFYEVGVYAVVAMLLSVALMWTLRLLGVAMIAEMMWYYTAIPYLLFALYNIILSILTVISFNHLLKGRLNA